MNLVQTAWAKLEAEKEQKKKGILKKIPRWIYYILGTLAALVGILHHLGWLEPLKRLFTR